MFARMVATALLVAGIGTSPLAWAADTSPAQPTQFPVPQQAAVPQPTAPSPAQAVAQPAPGTQPDAADDEETPPATPEGTNQPAPSGPLTSTDKIVKSFMQLDTDKSNAVSFDEYMVMVQQRAKDRYDAMDANHDGQVTPDEYRQFWLHRMAQWYRLKR
jgi:hypothetical protein